MRRAYEKLKEYAESIPAENYQAAGLTIAVIQVFHLLWIWFGK